jgi:hypothetical protein
LLATFTVPTYKSTAPPSGTKLTNLYFAKPESVLTKESSTNTKLVEAAVSVTYKEYFFPASKATLLDASVTESVFVLYFGITNETFNDPELISI